MARLILSEYAAKTLLIGDQYVGVSFDGNTDCSQVSIPQGSFVVKVDDGTKKRNQKGLVKLGLNETEAIKQASRYLELGYRRVLIEPMSTHQQSTEQYLSCTLVRAGVEVLYSETGGNEIEMNGDVIQKIVSTGHFFSGEALNLDEEGIPSSVLNSIRSSIQRYNFAFVEINPFIINDGGGIVFLDAAVELDSSKIHLLPEWVTKHIQDNTKSYAAESAIKTLNEQSTASFSLTVFDENASIFTLLSGGGASLVVLDTFVDSGMQLDIANYGEYSGAPTRDETKFYTDELLTLLLASKAPRKVLVIAGGVANFTDISVTFSGIIDSCTEHLEELKRQLVLVIVRRGGPRQVEGLAALKAFFIEHNIPAIVSDPTMPLSQITIEAKKFIEQSQ